MAEVMVVPRNRSQAAHLPEQPLQGLDPPCQICRDEAPRLLGEVEQYRARFEHRDRRFPFRGRVVDQRRDAVIRRDAQEIGLELLTPADVHRLPPSRTTPPPTSQAPPPEPHPP